MATKAQEQFLNSMQSLFEESTAKKAKNLDKEAVKAIVQAELKNFKTVSTIEVKNVGNTKKIEGVAHEKLQEVIQIVNANEPVYMAGPAGTGKSSIAKQVAKALDLDFYFTNCITQEYQLTGFIDANGHYHETSFYKAFKNGGVFFLDELDGSLPDVLIHLNTAIANRFFDFPGGTIEANPNFRVIAAGNTAGTGADSEYTGRYQLDLASLDRFYYINIDYSKNIETAISGGDEDLIRFAHEWRKSCNQAGISCLFTYRAIGRIAKLSKVLPLNDVLKGSLLKALSIDDIRIILAGIDVSGTNWENNPYYISMTDIIAKAV